MKILFTWFKGKLTAAGVSVILLNEVFELVPDIVNVWTTSSGEDIGLTGAIGAVAMLWGFARRFTTRYKND